MSSTKLSNKIVRVTEERRLRNSSVKTRLKTTIAAAEKFIESGNAKSAREGARTAISTIDGAISKGIIKRNKGARLKSQLAKKLNQAIRQLTEKKKGG